ncbi:MAG: alcohol dehydrogenase catalytic domain-containing protein [Anaerolineales bacterium]|nr:alcohol dehydrogenase catalytic domain-containing protein [Anaerolineales bacterium]MDO9348399.1 alcohol dehydrogenase catalytic domain-containing protein [Anaerolineales bacterium]
MKQAIMTEPGKIEFNDIPIGSPAAGQVLLRIQRIGVCGSDVHVYHGKHPYTSYPVVQGHEFSATVEAVGEGVQGIQPGMKVTTMPQIVCGVCAPCRRGDYHICDQLKVEGFQAPGCAQEFWIAEAAKVVHLPQGFSFEQGALVEPVSVAVHAVARAGSMHDRRVMVFGAGPIGNLVAQVTRAQGARVLLSEVSNFRLEVARKCGFEHLVNPTVESVKTAAARVFGPDGFDVAFECVGVQATIDDAINSITKGGTIVVVGVFGDKPRVDLGLVQDRELNLRGTLMYKAEDYQQAVKLIDQGAIITEPLMSRHFSFDEYLQAYQFIDESRDKVMKVFIDIA